MSHLGTLRDYRFSNVDEATDDVRGSKVYGFNDEKLGKIDDVIFDHASGRIQYVVIDTGGWLSSKKFLVPPQALRPSVDHDEDFRVDLSKAQIESFPPYNEADIESDEKWADYDGRYRSQWEANPVMHRVATDRNITPTTKQQIDAGSGSLPVWDDRDEEETVSDITPMRTEASLGSRSKRSQAGAGIPSKIVCANDGRRSFPCARRVRVRRRRRRLRSARGIPGGKRASMLVSYCHPEEAEPFALRRAPDEGPVHFRHECGVSATP